MVAILGLLIILIGAGMAANKETRNFSPIAFAVGVLVMVGGAIRIVDPGSVGVQVLFGSVREEVLQEGFHVVNPFVTVEEMSVRTESYTMSATRNEGAAVGDDSIATLSKDGLRMPVDATVSYRLSADKAVWVYRNIGPDYVEKIIRPASRTGIREAVSQFSAQEAYSSRRLELAAEITKKLEGSIEGILAKSQGYSGESAFVVQQVLVRNIDIPQRLKESIEAKLDAEQQALKMEFVLQKEKQEAERKQIEAEGIAAFQKIVSEGINDDLLKWKGIEATERLAESTNSKVVVIGGGGDGLPLILNGS